MFSDISGYFWFIAVAGGPLILGAVLAYGAVRQRRSRAQMERTGRGAPPARR